MPEQANNNQLATPGLLNIAKSWNGDQKQQLPGLMSTVPQSQNISQDNPLIRIMSLLGINKAQLQDLNRDHINQMVNNMLSIKPKDANWSLGLYSIGQNQNHLPDPAIRFIVPLDQNMMPVFNRNSTRR